MLWQIIGKEPIRNEPDRAASLALLYDELSETRVLLQTQLDRMRPKKPLGGEAKNSTRGLHYLDKSIPE